MNLNINRFSVLAASAAAIATALTAMPAQALSINGTLNLTGDVSVSEGSGNNFRFNFLEDGQNASDDLGTPGDVTIGGATGFFSGIGEVAGGAKIKDFIFPNSPVENFITGLTVGSQILSFDLTGFSGQSFSFGSTSGSSFFFGTDFEGVFRDQTGTAIAGGSFTANQRNNSQPGSFSATIDAKPIPTPALLPGLIGMGVATLRKRKAAEQEA